MKENTDSLAYSSIMHPHKIFKRVNDWEKDRTNRGAIVAKMVRVELERLSPFILSAVGTEVETGFKKDLIPTSSDLDYAVLYNGKVIAEIDVTDSNFTFKDSQCMPAKCYKGMKEQVLTVPTFLIYRMNKEPVPLKDQCVWIRGEDVVKCNHSVSFMGGKYQDNYWTNKADWNRGLESLIEELRKLNTD